VEQDVRDRKGDIVIPRGSDVELIVRELSSNNFVLDMDSVRMYGERYSGAGGVLGAIIGAIAGKSAAIAAVTVTRGRTVDVPAESLLTFRLDVPLRAGVGDNGYARNGVHYHHGYSTDRYPTQQTYREKPGADSNGRGMISIGRDNNISWQGKESGDVWLQVDNEEPKLFSSGQSGVQPAPWITRGHLYTFTLQDAHGNAVATAQLDLR
jgi:hypothetical protein